MPTIELRAGEKATLELRNAGVVEHDFVVDAAKIKAVVQPGKTATRIIGPLNAGTYEVYCSVPGHREAGMKGKLIVSADGSSGPLPASPQAEAPVASAPPTPAVAVGPGTDSLIARGRAVFETAGSIGCKTCHGSDAKGRALDGGNNAPDIRRATEQMLRNALAGGAAPMAFLKLRDAEIEAVIAYLNSLD